jgi:hypothetical protein
MWNGHRHPCFRLDSNPRSQYLSVRRRWATVIDTYTKLFSSYVINSLLLYKNIKIKILQTCNFACGSVREKHRLRVFENRVLRIFGPKRDEVTGGWRKLHNEELYNLYALTSIIRMLK